MNFRTLLTVTVALAVIGCGQTNDPVANAVTMNFELARGLDPDLIYQRGAPADWEPNANAPLDDIIPYDWPDQYIEQYQHRFHPSSYRANASMLCTWARRNPDREDEVKPIVDKLHDRMMEFTEMRDGARFIVYRFARTYLDDHLDDGWVSAYGNGAAIAGTVVLDECWPDEKYRETAMELAAAYEITNRDGMWFTRVTEDGYLWYEEIPIDDTPHMILNGHITAVTGLYYLWDRYGQDPDIEHLLQAGIASVHRYIEDYRDPGEINCYDRTPPCHDDYGPERTVRQQNLLYEMTGEVKFRKMRDRFGKDMGIDPEQFSAQRRD